MESKSDLVSALLHPLRLRIIQVLLPDRQLTAKQIARAAPDIPHASLYRHLSQLVEAGVLRVAGERQVRNLSEKVYALAGTGAFLDPAASVQIGQQDLLALFAAFAALLVSDFQRYLATHDPGPVDLG